VNQRRVRAEFEALVDQTPAVRAARLAELETTDSWLAAQVRDLLGQDAEAGNFLERGPVPESPVASQLAPDAGQHFGRYELVHPLGSGGMGSVWEATQRDPERRVALKLLPIDGRSLGEAWRFEQEVAVLASLQHPAIATFYEAGRTRCGDREVAWLAMELVDDAQDLLAWVTHRQLDRPARLELFERLGDAVRYGHRRGVLHRDLKPQNVLVDRDGALKLIDFGIAKALGRERERQTMTGQLVGTLRYMAPEQLRGIDAAVGTASDVWALGCILYELLCGDSPFPFAGSNWPEVARLVLEREPVPPQQVQPGLPADLGWILLRALAKDPQSRYPTVDALLDDLQRWRAHLPVTARAPSWGYRASRFLRRHRVGAAIAIALAAGSGVGVWGLWRGAEDARAGEAAAQAARAEAEQASALAQQRERAAVRANEVSREVVRVVAGLFNAIRDDAESPEVKVHELLDRATLDARATADPLVEQAVRELRGNAYLRLHRYAEAKRELERAYELQRLRPFEPEIAAFEPREHVLAAKLGRALHMVGERERASELLAAALTASEASANASIRSDVLAQYCSHLNGRQGYRELLVAAAQLREHAEQQSDPFHVVEALEMMSRAASALGRHDEAKAAATDALAAARRHFPDNAPMACGLAAARVTALLEAGDLATAEELLPDLIAQTTRLFGPHHRNTLAARNNRAFLLLQQKGRRDEALAILRENLEALQSRSQPMDRAHLEALNNLGMTWNSLGKFAEAEPLLREAAAASRWLFVESDIAGPQMRFNHGAVLAWQKRFAEAEPVLLAEYAAMQELLPADHTMLAKARRTLADAYRVNGQPERSEEWRER
jgi:eukaryotic-like serine/threonine-protein kinase